ncbi:MAG: hypothetical protein ABR613_09930, partial [Actinomycetota bacterium]
GEEEGEKEYEGEGEEEGEKEYEGEGEEEGEKEYEGEGEEEGEKEYEGRAGGRIRPICEEWLASQPDERGRSQ